MLQLIAKENMSCTKKNQKPKRSSLLICIQVEDRQWKSFDFTNWWMMIIKPPRVNGEDAVI